MPRADSLPECSEQSQGMAWVVLTPIYINPDQLRAPFTTHFHIFSSAMNTTTQVSLSIVKSPVALTNRDLQPPTASVCNIPERPRAHVSKLPLLRYEEEHPTIIVSDADEKYCLTGYGDLPVSEEYDSTETGEDEHKLRVPRLQRTRPRAQYQTTKTVSRPVSKSNSGDTTGLLLTSEIQQLEPEVFRNVIQATSANPPETPNTDFRVFFENLLSKSPPIRRRQRSLILQTSSASEAVDAHPRSN